MPDPIPPRHYVNIGPDGTFRPSGAVQTKPEDVDAILEAVRSHAPGKVAIHFHGGLVKEAKGLELAGRIIPTYERGGAYPITVVWETGLLETVTRNLATFNHTKLFNKLVNYAIRHAAKWLGASVGTRGPGEPMSMAEIESARVSDAEMEQMDVRAKGPGGVRTEADVEAVEPDIEAEVQADLEADDELSDLLETDAADRRVLDPQVLAKIDAEGQRGIVSTVTVAKLVARVVARTLKRFTSDRDHGVIPTVVEEVLREAYLAQVGEWIWTGMKTAAENMWKPNSGPIEQSSHAGTYLLEGIAKLQQDQRPDLKIDLIGHSAGSIAIAHMLEAAAERHPELHVRNLVLLAPAASADVFEHGIRSNEGLFDTFRMFTMEDALECKDHLVPGVYPRSLLYLISGILDGEADSPVVGLRRHTSGQAPYDRAPLIDVSRFLAQPENRLVLSKTRDDAGEGLRTWSARHGDFDNDEQTLASLTAIVAN
jgi:pimeloyl-ACP methyl ester carboxylesterase